MNDLTRPPSRLLKTTAVAVRSLLWVVLVAWMLFFAAWGALHGWIVPRIGEFRPRMEVELGKALGVPVRIGAIDAQSVGMIPSFELRDVTLLDAGGHVALRLPRILAALSPASLWKLGFEQLYIEKPELDIRRSPDGRIHVAGLDFSRADADSSGAADWFFSQTELVIRHGTVRWTDELRGAPPLALTDVDWVVRNSVRRHHLRLDATPPPEWGERFSLRGQFRQPLLSMRDGQWQEWAGQIYAELPRVDLSQLRQYASPGIDVRQGRGSVRGWLDVGSGQVLGGTLDVALAGVDAVLGEKLAPLGLESVTGRMSGRRLAAGFEFSTQDLQFRTSDGLQWPGGNFFLSLTEAQDRLPAQGELRADRLDLAALAEIGNRLPLSDEAHAQLVSFAPKGLVERVQARWQGHLGALDRLEASGRVSQLSLAASPGTASGTDQSHAGRPGLRGATVDFELSQTGGRAKVAIANGAIDVPGALEDPVIPMEQLGADVQWQLKDGQIDVQLANAKFANAHLQGEAQASWRTGDAARGRFPGVLDLQATIAHADGTKVYRYLPASVPKHVRDYVHDAVQQGEASGGRIRIRGDLHDFPFADSRQGEFRIAARVQNATFAFVPRSVQPRDTLPWPTLSQLSGELIFDRLGMEVRGASGRIGAGAVLQVTKADAHIPDLFKSVTVVVSADARGPLPELLGLVNGSPLGALAGHVLSRTTATGSADYKLRLQLPLATLDKSRVQGTVTLAGNDVQMSPDTPMLARSRGMVSFSESGFAITGAQSRMLGGDLRFEGGTRPPQAQAPGLGPETTIVFRGQGVVTAEGLRQAKELGFASRLGTHATGSAAYSAVLGFRRGVPELTVSTNLQGMGLSLPPPLAKLPDAVLPVRYENTLLRESLQTGQKLQDQLAVDIGRIASIVYVRDVSGAEPRVLRGGIGVGLQAGETAPAPEDGVVANINFTSVDLDAWQSVLTPVANAAPVAAGPARVPGTAAAASASQAYLPSSMAIRARELKVEGRKLNNVVVGGSREGLNWRANLYADELNGYVDYRQPAGGGAGRLFARLARLSIAPAAASEVEAILDEQPTSVPALDIVVDDLELRGRRLGRVEIEAINRGAQAVAREGGVREWRLNKFNIVMPEATLTASGNWAAINAQAPAAPRAGGRPAMERRRTVMNFALDIADSGELLRRFGMANVIRRGKGKLEGQVAWAGSPLALDYPSMSGQFNVNVESGQFLKADPGLAKLLGVLSLQALPRRLTLDFRDVFTEGFSFDFIRGDIHIDQGVAVTNNLQMKGVNAAVLMEGKADIGHETQDLKVVVVPELNAGTASIIATVINPAVGVGTFLAQLFLRRPLIQAATQEFHIDGTWADPKVARVARKPVTADAAQRPVEVTQ